MTRLVAIALVLAAALQARADGLAVAGEYDSPLGRVRVTGDGTAFKGTLVTPAGACRLVAGTEVLQGTLLDDSLAGQVRLCLAGPGCPAEAWAGAVLLVAPGGLIGAAHVAKGCQAPLGKSGGITFRRVVAPAHPGAAPQKAPPAPLQARPARTAPSARERARQVMRDGFDWLKEGNFERARKRFQEAVELDPRLPEAFNGMGVTYRMRDDLEAAVQWYKKALAVDPDFGDAYYNLACVYALQGQTELALRYLQIAAVNGYVTAEGIDGDDDLASLRSTPAYQALVKAKL